MSTVNTACNRNVVKSSDCAVRAFWESCPDHLRVRHLPPGPDPAKICKSVHFYMYLYQFYQSYRRISHEIGRYGIPKFRNLLRFPELEIVHPFILCPACCMSIDPMAPRPEEKFPSPYNQHKLTKDQTSC